VARSLLNQGEISTAILAFGSFPLMVETISLKYFPARLASGMPPPSWFQEDFASPVTEYWTKSGSINQMMALSVP
jgi:hypothetical protein